jgi:hypothetical protein
MAAKKKKRGQSILEFVILVPLFLSALLFLLGVHSALQISINNQKFARSRLIFLFFNNRWGLESSFSRNTKKNTFFTRYWVGVDKEIVRSSDGAPTAPTQQIGRKIAGAADNDAAGEVDYSGTRQNIRIRTTVFTCLPPHGVNFTQPFSDGGMGESTFKQGGFIFCGNDK